MNRTMQPRLRGTVTYLRTGAGMIFRNGDSFLPINGNGVWDSYQAIKPLVESAQPDKELFSELETILHGPMAKLITALESAGMLYDATNDGGGNLPPEALAYFDRERARLETKSDFPLKTFAQLRAKRVLIAGTSEMVTATAEAALGTGLCHLILLLPAGRSKTNCGYGRWCGVTAARRMGQRWRRMHGIPHGITS